MREEVAGPELMAARIRSGGKLLDYEAQALEGLAWSWEAMAEGKNDGAALAVMHASVWAQLHQARVTAAQAEPRDPFGQARARVSGG